MSDALKGLEALRDIHVGPSILDSIPITAVTIAMGLILAAGALFLARIRFFSGRAVRRGASQALAMTAGLPPSIRIAEQAKVLRRVARTIGGEEMARLNGEAWLQALDRIFRTRFFSEDEGRCFADDLYGARPTADADLVAARLQGLVRKLRV